VDGGHCARPAGGGYGMGGRAGDWVGALEERRMGRQARPQPLARTPDLMDRTVGVQYEGWAEKRGRGSVCVQHTWGETMVVLVVGGVAR
jgi:hypothetical protein